MPPLDTAAERLTREDAGYHKALKNRQIQMIALGGAIGTGLFSQAFRSPSRIFWRSNFSRRPSRLTTMYGISSLRS